MTLAIAARSRRRAHGADRSSWWLGYVSVVGVGLMLAYVASRRVSQTWVGLSIALLILLVIAWLLRPRAALYATILLTAVSDQVTIWWFPFAKNLSSRESIAFVADPLTVSPLELSLFCGATITLTRYYARTHHLLPRTPLTWPLTVFSGFVVFGLARGIVIGGGDTRVAILESRALFYILLTFLIVNIECTTKAHLRWALGALLAGVTIQSVLSIVHLEALAPAYRETLESLTEHGSAIGQNLMLVTLLSLMMLGIKRPLTKLALTVALVPTVYVFFVAQRRAGVAALVVAGALLAISQFWRNRRSFWFVVPILTIALVGYVGAFWNSTSSAAFPAQAIKTIIAPDSASAEDLSSDLYRMSEAYDLNFTIRTDPLRGLGFGRPFYRPIPLADISVFELNAYMSHNAILWIWIKLGFGGFVAMFYFLAKAIATGSDRIRRIPRDVDLAVMVSAVAFVVMYSIYTWVDVSWDARNTVFLGLALAIVAHPVHEPPPLPPRRTRVPLSQVADEHLVDVAA